MSDYRIGDVVQLKNFRVAVIDRVRETLFLHDELGVEHKFSVKCVEKLVSRALTPEEEIAKLKKELAEAQNVIRIQEKELSSFRWYPPIQDGFGPWIEGPPPLNLTKNFQILIKDERRTKTYESAILFEPDQHQHSVAYCVEL